MASLLLHLQVFTAISLFGLVFQHFRSLTLAFLKPFETYFQIKKNPNIPSLAFGPYDDLVSYLLPKFDEKVSYMDL